MQHSNINKDQLRQILASPDKTIKVWCSSSNAEVKTKQLFTKFRDELLSRQPSRQPSKQPSRQPSKQPSRQPSKTDYQCMALTDYFKRREYPPADLTVMLFDINNAPVPTFSIANLIKFVIQSFKMVEITLPSGSKIHLPSFDVSNSDIMSIIGKLITNPLNFSLIPHAKAFNDFMDKSKEFIKLLHRFLLAALYMMSCRTAVDNNPFLLLFSGDLKPFIDYIRNTLVEFTDINLTSVKGDEEKFRNMLMFILKLMDALVGPSQSQQKIQQLDRNPLSDQQKQKIKQLAKHGAQTTKSLFDKILQKAGKKYRQFLQKMSKQQDVLKPVFDYLQKHTNEAPWARLIIKFLSFLINEYARCCQNPATFKLNDTQFNKWKKLIIKHSKEIIDILLEKIRPYALLNNQDNLPTQVMNELTKSLASLKDSNVITWSNRLNFQVAVCATYEKQTLFSIMGTAASQKRTTTPQRASITMKRTTTPRPTQSNKQIEFPCPLFIKSSPQQRQEIVTNTILKVHPRSWLNDLLNVIAFWKKDKRVQKNIQQYLQNKYKLQAALADPRISLYYKPQYKDKIRTRIRQLYANDYDRMLGLIDEWCSSISQLHQLENALYVDASNPLGFSIYSPTPDQQALFNRVHEVYNGIRYYINRCFTDKLKTTMDFPITELSKKLLKLTSKAKDCKTTGSCSNTDQMVVNMVDGICQQILILIQRNCPNVVNKQDMANKLMMGKVVDPVAA